MIGWIVAAGLIVVPIDEPPKTPRERFESLQLEYNAQLRACVDAYKKATTDAERQATIKLEPDDAAYARKYFELANDAPKDPVALDALYEMLLLRRGPLTAEGLEALERLRRECATSPKIADYLQQLSLHPWPQIIPLLREVLERNPDRTARGLACLGLAQQFGAKVEVQKLARDPATASQLREGYGPDYFEAILKEDPETYLRAATALYERVVAEFADVKYFPAYPNDKTTLLKFARSWLDARADLAIGKVAPEIEGSDLDGRVFKLSDHQGKVVVVVFWASWCHACVEQIPAEKALVEKLRGRPFALLGVNCDYKPVEARKAIAERAVDWRNWYDGDPREGKIAGRYHVQSFPTVFVLDARGVIREKDVRGEALEKAVEALLAEQPGPAR